MKHNPIITSFTAGEFSPWMYGRVDLQKYSSGSRKQLNCIVKPQGPYTRRSGTRFVAEAKDSSKYIRLIPFQFSTTQAYIIEFGNLYCRFYKDEGQIISGLSPYEIVTTYLEADLPYLQFSQNADYLFITHPNYKPRRITRTGHTSWTIADIDLREGPYMEENVTTTTLTPSAVSGLVTITASSTTGINDDTGFQSSDVTRWIRIKNGANWGAAQIASVTNSTQVIAQTTDGFSATTATTAWRLGALCEFNGWPQSNVFHEQRWVLGGSKKFANYFWMSRTGLSRYNDFKPSDPDGTVNDDHSISYAIANNQVSAIRWLSSNITLQIGTSDSECVVKASTISEPISPTNIQVSKQSNSGSANIQALVINNSTVYVSETGRRLMEMVYDLARESYISNQMTLFSEHIPINGGSIKAISYNKEPNGIIYCVLNSGDIAACTFLKEQDVLSFGLHRVGGSFGSGHSIVESVATIKAQSGANDQTWISVKRTINGSTKRYVEFFEEQFDGENDQKPNMFFVDSGLTYSGAPALTISGLSHLIGETVQILADGSEHESKVVSNTGTVTLDRQASVVQIGLGYNTDMWTLRLEGGGNFGTSQGKVGRIHEAAIRFYNTLYCKVGTKESDIRHVEFRKFSDPMGDSPPLFSGDKEIKLDGSYDSDRSIFIRQDKPYPLTVLAIMPRITVNE